jgi:thymidine phosphorylase
VVQAALPAPADGYVTTVDALSVGIAAWRLGAGRARIQDAVDHAAGVRLLAKPGDYVRKGQHIAELHGDERVHSGYVLEALAGAVTVGTEPPAERGVILERVGFLRSRFARCLRCCCMTISMVGFAPRRSSS